MIRIKFSTANAAFCEEDGDYGQFENELRDVLEKAVLQILDQRAPAMNPSTKLMDSNGNSIGTVTYEEEE